MATATKKKSPVVDIVISTFDLSNRPIYRVIRKTTLARWKRIDYSNYEPAGSTPLRDATVQFINHLDSIKKKGRVVIGCLVDESGSMSGNRQSVVDGLNEFVGSMMGIEANSDSDGKVLAVIFTDGLENTSKEVSPEQLRDLIKQKESEDWSFIYLGANHDAWAVGYDYGFSNESSGTTFTYDPSYIGTTSALRSAGAMSASYLQSNSNYKKVATSGIIDEKGEINDL